MLGRAVTDSPYMRAELVCYNEADNLAVNQLSAVWAHHLLKRRATTVKAVEKLRFEFMLRQIGRVSSRTVDVVTAPLYEVCRNACGWWSNQELTDSMRRTWQQTMYKKLSEYNRGVEESLQVKITSEWRPDQAAKLEDIYQKYSRRPDAGQQAYEVV